ncbi:hypothetical protein [Bradyrhizobium sp.]|uniref:hypothetical protein n=1 Tax=Bradyrhizobium sp. TaxID=376 RepID=UPI003C7167B6
MTASPGTLERVAPVAGQGTRVCVFFSAAGHGTGYARSLISDLDTATRAPLERLGRNDPETVKLTGITHHLIRHWTEVCVFLVE